MDKTENADNKKVAATLCVIFTLILYLMFLGYSVPVLFYPTIKYFQVKSWPRQECTITECKVKTHSFSNRKGYRTGYSIQVRYSYEYDNVDYESGRFGFQDKFFKQYYYSFREAKVIAKDFRFSPNATCYVNPDNPSQAVLSLKIDSLFKKIFYSLLAFSMATAMMVVTVKQLLFEKKETVVNN